MCVVSVCIVLHSGYRCVTSHHSGKVWAATQIHVCLIHISAWSCQRIARHGLLVKVTHAREAAWFMARGHIHIPVWRNHVEEPLDGYCDGPKQTLLFPNTEGSLEVRTQITRRRTTEAFSHTLETTASTLNHTKHTKTHRRWVTEDMRTASHMSCDDLLRALTQQAVVSWGWKRILSLRLKARADYSFFSAILLFYEFQE